MFGVKFKYFFIILFLAVSCSPETPSSEPEPKTSVTISPSLPAIPSPQATPSKKRPQLLLLGSTLSVARGLPPEQGYAALLQQRLSAAQAPFSILNASVAAETAAGAAERLSYLLAQPPEQVILELGQADEERKTPPGAFARDVRKLLQNIRTQQPQAPILILASSRKRSYLEPLAAAAEAHGAVLSSLLIESGQPVRSDDPALHRRLAEELWPLVKW
ncbi:MAG: hypothetical protein J5I98_13655 [Phaeodactylibacter sp.]|nr:hypothetical protein [Phaeodactylibacter sp.]